MRKDIVVIEDFCGSLDGSDNDRFPFICNMLSLNNDVELITSDFCHRTKKPFVDFHNNYRYKVLMIHEKPYKKNISLKRFISHYFWGIRVGKYLRHRKKPDAIYCAIPTLKAASIAGKYCKKNKIKFLVDIQDLWPEAFKMVFNIPIVSKILFAPFSALANSAYKNANEIVAVSQTYLNRALSVNKITKTGHPVFLGTSSVIFDRNVKEYVDLAKREDEVWVGYCGTLGASYDLKIVFDALRLLNDSKIRFIVMGTGPKASEFQEYSNGLNVVFTGFLDYKKMCGLLHQCDIAVNPITHNAAQSIINKHADYCAAGLPIVNTQECQEYRDLIEKYQMGFNVDNDDPEMFAKALKELCEDSSLRIKMGTNSRSCFDALFNRETTYLRICELF